MKELSVIQLEEVAGGYGNGFVKDLVEANKSAIVGGITAGWAGAIIGGKYGGDDGGILGFGEIGSLVGLIVGGVYGTVGGAVGGAVVGWAKTSKVSGDIVNGIISGTI